MFFSVAQLMTVESLKEIGQDHTKVRNFMICTVEKHELVAVLYNHVLMYMLIGCAVLCFRHRSRLYISL